MRWYWLCESHVLESLVVLFRRLSYWSMGVSNHIGDAAMRSAEILDPVGVEWRRQELLRWVELEKLNPDRAPKSPIDK